MAKREFAASTLLFALILVLTSVLAFFYLPFYGKSNIWRIDGLTQHYPTLVYFNRLVRDFLADPSGGLPLWSWQAGLGADTLGSLAHYVIGDPFILLSLPFAMDRLDQAYELMFFARVLVAGIVGFWYLRKMGTISIAAAAGSLVYVFTTFTLFSAMRHPFFLNAMIWLPLLLIGVEKVFRRERPYLLVLGVYLAATNNFYFFYMITLVVVIYTLVRHIDLTERGHRLRQLPSTLLRVGGTYALGSALAAFVLVPVLIAFFTSSRSGSNPPLQLLYPVREYGSYVVSLITHEVPANGAYMGFSVLALLLAPVLLMRRRKNLTTRVMVVMFAVFLAFPVFGWVFNGFSYAGNRYLFAWGLFLALGVAAVLSDPTPLSRRELLVSFAVLAAYAVLALYADARREVLVPVLLGALMLVVFAVESFGFLGSRIPRIGARVFTEEWTIAPARWVIAALLVVNIGTNAMFRFDYRFSDMLVDWVDSGSAPARYAADPGMLATSLPSDEFYRVEKQRYVDGLYQKPISANDQLVQDYHGTALYLSLVDANVSQFMSEMQNRSSKMSYAYDGFDDRASLLALLGVKYYIADKDLIEFAPYGFEPVKRLGEAIILRNRNALPLGFVYEHVVPRRAYDGLPPLEKQQVMLSGAVVEDDVALSLPVASTPETVRKIHYRVELPRGASLERDSRSRLELKSAPATLSLDFPAVSGGELYVELADFEYLPSRERVKPVQGSSRLPGFLRRLFEYRRSQVAGMGPTRTRVQYRVSGGKSKWERWDTPEVNSRHEDFTQLVNLGYRRSKVSSINMTPRNRGTIEYGALSVYRVDLEGIDRRTEQLRRSGLRNVGLGKSSLAGEFSTAANGVLFLSVPYSPGWTATLDGRPVDVIRVNTAFCGVQVAPGVHRLRMRYVTPGLLPGLGVSGAALIALAAVAFVEERRRRLATNTAAEKTSHLARRGVQSRTR